MNIDELIRITKTVYEEAINSEKDEDTEKDIEAAKKDLLKSQEKKISNLNKLKIPKETTILIEEAFNSEMNAYDNILESLTLPNRSEVNKLNTDSYISAVKEFSKSGGKNFYDIGSLVDVKYESDVVKFIEKIKELQDSGLDIKILAEEKIGNKEMSSYSTESSFALVMPSSVYYDYEKMMVTNFPEEMFNTQSPALRSNFFIAPLIELRDQIDEMSEVISKRINLPKSDPKKKRISKDLFSAFCYSTCSLDTKGGYGIFEKYRPDKKALISAVEHTLTCASIYRDKSRHSNTMQPTRICYSSTEKIDRGILEEGQARLTIEKGLLGYEAEQKRKAELENKNATQKKSRRTNRPS